MIEFFLTPQRLKLLLAGGGALLAAVAVLFVCVVYLDGALDTERAAHATTKERLATAVREGVRWKTATEAADVKITSLQGEVRACLAREAQATADAAERERILSNAQPRTRTPAEREEVVDDATRSKAIVRLIPSCDQ